MAACPCGSHDAGVGIEEVREHDGLRRMAWVVVWIILGILALVSLVALGHVVRAVATRLLLASGMFSAVAGLVRSAAILVLLVGAIVLPVVVVVRLVRARSAPPSPGGSGALKEAFGPPTLIFTALLVLAWSAIYQPVGPLATGALATSSPSLFYVGLVLLAIGIALFVTAPRLTGSATAVALAEGEQGGQSASSQQPTRERERRERSHLGAFTVGAVLIIVAILGLLGSFGLVNIDIRIFPALVLTALGAGILLGTWVGRALWLTILCVMTLPFVALANIIDLPIAGGVGSVTYSPHTGADLADSYSFGVGRMTLDLSALKATDPNTTVLATLAAGDLLVEVPSGVHVVIDSSVRAGQIEISGHHAGVYRSGLDLSTTSTFGSDSPGLVHLIVHCGVGTIRVYAPGTTLPEKQSSSSRQGPKSSPGKGKP